MFISKRKWEEMCERICMLDATNGVLIQMVDRLENSHKELFKDIKNVKDFGECLNTKIDRQYWELRKDIRKGTSTKEISNITLEELARLVIDGTPITRKVMEENIKEYGRRVD